MMQTPVLRVLLADDHDVVRKGVRALLEDQPGWQVCAEANTGVEAVELAAKTNPDIVVLDLEMKELDGLEATRRIKTNQPEVEVMIFTIHDTEYLHRKALAAGARAFVLKSEGGRKLVEAVANLSKDKAFREARVSEALLCDVLRSDGEESHDSPLTQREREIVQLLADGKSNKEAALVMSISVKTVETHRASIMRKLNLNSIVDLVRYAVREGLIKA